ncbi:MAG: hypothetical protein K1000chlam2_01223 [Chlamydiae bacterium]|nr:hypothetical protein [Chlamydiota bacterium]
MAFIGGGMNSEKVSNSDENFDAPALVILLIFFSVLHMKFQKKKEACLPF